MMSSEPKVSRLLQNLEQLFVEGQNSDVTLKVENQEFPVHRGILAARSPVFACMFQHDTAEKFSGIVNIPDCSVEAFEVLLRYLYTGNVNTISAENVFSVYYAADKYCIDDLKEHIIEFLKNNLSPENCFDVFTLSVRHSDLELQKLTTDFFCQNLMKLVNTVQWRNFLKENSVEVNKLLRGTLDCLKLKNI